jgi:hypothetical protein
MISVFELVISHIVSKCLTSSWLKMPPPMTSKNNQKLKFQSLPLLFCEFFLRMRIIFLLDIAFAMDSHPSEILPNFSRKSWGKLKTLLLNTVVSLICTFVLSSSLSHARNGALHLLWTAKKIPKHYFPFWFVMISHTCNSSFPLIHFFVLSSSFVTCRIYPLGFKNLKKYQHSRNWIDEIYFLL